MTSCLVEGVAISNLAHRPEGLIKKRILPLPLSILAAMISAVVNTVLFIPKCALFVPAFAAVATYKCITGKEGKKYAVAALLNLAGLVASAAFFGAAAFCFPFPLTCALLLTAVSVSLIFHIVKSIKG